MHGKGVRQYLDDLCARIDVSEKTAKLKRAAMIVAIPAAAAFTTACYAAPYGEAYPYSPDDEICHNGLDDDYDGLTDCADDDCARLEACLGCDDGLDNDGDGLADCSDPSCLRIAPCADELCGDMLDNDGDGLTDCDDEDCADTESCSNGYNADGSYFGGCSDGVDNDGDGLADCDDASCHDGELCQGLSACFDALDNDGDGRQDCDDPDCGREPICN